MGRFATFASPSCLPPRPRRRPRRRRPPPRPSAAGSRDRIICRRYVRIGSLVDGYRTCKTRADWDREQANVRQFSVSDSCTLRGDPDPARGAHRPTARPAAALEESQIGGSPVMPHPQRQEIGDEPVDVAVVEQEVHLHRIIVRAPQPGGERPRVTPSRLAIAPKGGEFGLGEVP